MPDSPLIYGCMNLGGTWDASPLTDNVVRRAHVLIDTALDCDITRFDHADIYARGKSEEVFGRVLSERPGLRDQIEIQTKCGIVLPEGEGGVRYDLSPEYVTAAVEASLRRLQIERIDVLLLHRPDPLTHPCETAQALQSLHASGKVAAFGVSNYPASHFQALRAVADVPWKVHQVEVSLLHPGVLSEVTWANRADAPQPWTGASDARADAQSASVELQAWSPLAKGLAPWPPDDANEKAHRIAGVVAELSEHYHASREAIALAWLTRAGITPVVGTTTAERLRAAAQVRDVVLSPDDWYRLFAAATAPMP